VLEARRTVTKDDEVQTVVLSGMCRREDVTNANSVLSSQLADMTLTVSNEGELNQANKPGWITRAFRTVFDF
jgi:flagellar L-ring protein precursor FlgH